MVEHDLYFRTTEDNTTTNQNTIEVIDRTNGNFLSRTTKNGVGPFVQVNQNLAEMVLQMGQMGPETGVEVVAPWVWVWDGYDDSGDERTRTFLVARLKKPFRDLAPSNVVDIRPHG